MRPSAVFFILIIMSLSSCMDNYGICDIDRSVSMQGKFYGRSGTQEVLQAAPSFSLTQLNPNTAVLYSQQPNQPGFGSLLTPAVDTLNYEIRFSQTLQPDTFRVVYTSQLHNVSTECGTITIYHISNMLYTKHTLDSIAVIEPDVSNTTGQNLKLYF